MKRQPIITEPKQIVMVQTQPTIHDLIPDYQYQFQDEVPDVEAHHMYAELIDFLSTNEDLALSDIIDKGEYSKGFKKAIAMVKLWIDSIYLHNKADGGVTLDELNRSSNNTTSANQKSTNNITKSS